jgi:hypothetical protein
MADHGPPVAWSGLGEPLEAATFIMACRTWLCDWHRLALLALTGTDWRVDYSVGNERQEQTHRSSARAGGDLSCGIP